MLEINSQPLSVDLSLSVGLPLMCLLLIQAYMEHVSQDGDTGSKVATTSLPESTQVALAHCFANLVDLLGECHKMLEAWTRKGGHALGLVKRFLSSSFYEMELRDVSR
jgi:hypothetical protein